MPVPAINPETRRLGSRIPGRGVLCSLDRGTANRTHLCKNPRYLNRYRVNGKHDSRIVRMIRRRGVLDVLACLRRTTFRARLREWSFGPNAFAKGLMPSQGSSRLTCWQPNCRPGQENNCAVRNCLRLPAWILVHVRSRRDSRSLRNVATRALLGFRSALLRLSRERQFSRDVSAGHLGRCVESKHRFSAEARELKTRGTYSLNSSLASNAARGINSIIVRPSSSNTSRETALAVDQSIGRCAKYRPHFLAGRCFRRCSGSA